MTLRVGFHCLVMAGGQGTRFWPESTSKKPKQFLNLFSDRSLLFETFDRFDGLIDKESRFVVTVQSQVDLVHRQCPSVMAEEGIVVEPLGRNTAPCILLALLSLRKKGALDSDIVAIVPADHVILNRSGFQKTLIKAKELAQQRKKIVTIGVPPHFPHTGYGYIKKASDLGNQAFVVDRFVEKPDLETAKSYLASGDYLWNAGMFVTPLGLMLEELQRHSPSIFEYAPKLEQQLDSPDQLEQTYAQIPSDSIDYAVMEKSENILVVPAEFDWNDLGSWTALEDVCEKREGNSLKSKFSESYLENAEGNIVFAPDQLVCLHQVKDLIVVSNDNVLMVMPKSEGQAVKQIRSWADQQPNLKDLI